MEDLDDADLELPSDLRRLWLPAGSDGGPSRSLNRERIVAAAIELADTEGLPALSMARLAERLGSAPMSLYRHVASKDELYGFMIDEVGRNPEPISAEDWRSGLRTWAANLMRLYARHPWILQLPITRPPLEPGQLDWLEQGLLVQQSAPLTDEERMSVVLVLLAYARGQAALMHGLSGADPGYGLPMPYGQLLARLIDEARYPVLSASVAAGLFEPPAAVDHPELQADTDVGVQLILDGVAAMISGRE